MLLMQYAAILAASQPALRPLLTRAVWLTRHDPCVCRHDRLSISGEHCHQRDRGLGATIDQAGARLGLVEEIVGAPLPQRRHHGKKPLSHLGQDVLVVQAGFAERDLLEDASSTSRRSRPDSSVLASPGSAAENSMNRVEPVRASRMISNAHLSPGTSSERATGHGDRPCLMCVREPVCRDGDAWACRPVSCSAVQARMTKMVAPSARGRAMVGVAQYRRN